MSVKRPALLIGGVILAATLGTAGAWLTWPRQASSPRAANATPAKSSLALTAIPAKPEAKSAAPIVVPEAAAPPAPTGAEFARATTAPETPAPPATEPAASIDWTALPIDELRTRANADELAAMEEMARRLVQGVGVPKDQQAGAGWLLRAAQHGSAQSAFNVGVMYERGFVVERDSMRAVEWYRKASEANLPMAKQHLALMLREGKGVARNGQEAVELLRAASRQGLAVSMFTLGDIYERGDVLPKDPAMALAWYAITAEFDRQTNRGGGDNAIAKTAAQRAQALRSTLLPGDLERAQQASQREFKQIVEALRPPKAPPPLVPSDLPPVALPAPALPPAAFPVPAPGKSAAANPEPDPPGWPKAANDQISAIQQALFDLKLLSDKPDGAIGPVTRMAIRTFQRSTGARETGEPTKDVFAALQQAIARRAAAASAAAIDLSASEPPPPPTSADIARMAPAPQKKTESAKVEPPIAPTPIAPVIELGAPEPPPAPPTSVDIARATPVPQEKTVSAKVEPAIAPAVEVGAPEPPPAPPTSADIARATPVPEEKTLSAKIEPPVVAPTAIDPPKPPMPKIEAATTAPPPIVATPGEPKPVPTETAPQAAIDLGQPEPPPAPPTSADIVRADPDAWPALTADQVTAVQRLLRDLNFLRDPPDGLFGPATRAAILDYERSAGLAQTGEPSKVLFESLKETREKAMRKPN
jgi:peptidoglycan hydrolase-like protein with peptidoglycan-binding domain